MNMMNVKRLTVMAFLGAGMFSGISAQESPLQADTLNGAKLLHNGICNRASTMPWNRILRFAKTV